jgi:hypothetical protein
MSGNGLEAAADEDTVLGVNPSIWNHKCLIRAHCHPERSEGLFLRPQRPLAALGVTAGCGGHPL